MVCTFVCRRGEQREHQRTVLTYKLQTEEEKCDNSAVSQGQKRGRCRIRCRQVVLDERLRDCFEYLAVLKLDRENCKSCPLSNAIQLRELAVASRSGLGFFSNLNSRDRAQIHLSCPPDPESSSPGKAAGQPPSVQPSPKVTAFPSTLAEHQLLSCPPQSTVRHISPCRGTHHS